MPGEPIPLLSSLSHLTLIFGKASGQYRLERFSIGRKVSTACLSRAGLKCRPPPPATAGGTDSNDLPETLGGTESNRTFRIHCLSQIDDLYRICPALAALADKEVLRSRRAPYMR